MYSEAIARAEEAVERFDGAPRLLAALAEAYAAAGRTTEAEKVLEALATSAEESYVDPVLFALIHIALGDHDAAFEMLEMAYENRSPWLALLSVDPRFVPVRDDPRFEDLLRRTGLAPAKIGERERAA